jgi:hypothetical protein
MNRRRITHTKSRIGRRIVLAAVVALVAAPAAQAHFEPQAGRQAGGPAVQPASGTAAPAVDGWRAGGTPTVPSGGVARVGTPPSPAAVDGWRAHVTAAATATRPDVTRANAPAGGGIEWIRVAAGAAFAIGLGILALVAATLGRPPRRIAHT